MRIGNTNFFSASLFAQRALRNNVASQKISIEKLATGKRINRAGDDAAGLSISNKLNTQIRGNRVAMNNIADGIGMLETIDAGVSAAQDIMQRMRELLVKGANGTNSVDERNILQTEFNELFQSLEDLSFSARYLQEGKSILRITNLGGGANPFRHPEVNIQAGSNENDLLNLDIDADGVNDRGIYISPNESFVGVPGSMQFGNTYVLRNTYFGGTKETANGTTFINRGPEDYLPDMDNMIGNLSRMRSELGAKMNTLNSRFNYLDRYNQSLMEANSRIEDTDFAAESSRLLKSQIQSQAASAVLAQANGQASIVLSLIPGGR